MYVDDRIKKRWRLFLLSLFSGKFWCTHFCFNTQKVYEVLSVSLLLLPFKGYQFVRVFIVWNWIGARFIRRGLISPEPNLGISTGKIHTLHLKTKVETLLQTSIKHWDRIFYFLWEHYLPSTSEYSYTNWGSTRNVKLNNGELSVFQSRCREFGITLVRKIWVRWSVHSEIMNSWIYVYNMVFNLVKLRERERR